jgi:hypothetical protein
VRRLALLLAVLACSLASADARAAPRVALFPTPLTPLTSTPPFQPPQTALPNVYRPPIRSSELIEVGVGNRGEVVSVAATQRLFLTQTGDYRLTVPAPATDVVPGPGSQSSPGLRRGAILWQGFADRHKLLSAKATLDPAAAAAALPLKLEMLSDHAVRLENVTETDASTFTAAGDRAQLAQILDTLRRHPDGLRLGQGTYVKVKGTTRALRVRVSAPLRVTGRIGATQIELLLGSGSRTIRFRGRASIDLRVEAVPPAQLLRPPRGRSWTEALRLGALPDARTFFRLAAETSLTLARVRQYDSPLVNPDSLGPIGARYVYRSAAVTPPPVPPPPTGQNEGLAAWLLALIVAGSVAAAGGLAVLWAHS